MSECRSIIENIKSSYSIKNLFLFLSERQKLKMIIYNKRLKKILGVNIDAYKKVSGKTIIVGKNGIIKESIGNKLVFEGYYLNGKKNGVCKEFYKNGKLKFNGNYSNGKRNGKGSEFHDNGELKFKGEYLNGKKWNGTLYSINGSDHFEIKKGRGNIKEFNYYKKAAYEPFLGNYFENYEDASEIIFEGEFLNGEMRGKEYYHYGKLKFKGEYLDERRWNGKGYNIDGVLQFEIKDGKGHIKEYNQDGEMEFEGEYLNGVRHGKGKEYINRELSFEGEYLNGERNGKGKEYNYKGLLKFEGEYLNGEKMGKGKEYNYKGTLIFEGEYLNGEKHGKGKEYNFKGKLVFEGEYSKGKRNGKGKEYNDNGELIFEGEYSFGKRKNK